MHYWRSVAIGRVRGETQRKVCSEELGEGGLEGGRRRWVRGGEAVGGATLGGR